MPDALVTALEEQGCEYSDALDVLAKLDRYPAADDGTVATWIDRAADCYRNRRTRDALWHARRPAGNSAGPRGRAERP